MASAGTRYDIAETIHKHNDQVISVDFIVKITPENGKTQEKTVSIDEDSYKELVAKSKKPALPWVKFIKVLRSFMMAYSENDINEAFKILDADNSGTIDINELGIFLPALVPSCTPEKLMAHIKKIDKNTDQKMGLAEFSQLVKRCIGVQIVANT